MQAFTPNLWRLSPLKNWTLDRPRVLAILNLTPDSFSDGGELADPAAAARAAAKALAAGADGLDVGGESTRPGAVRISAEEQIRRVVPAIEEIRRVVGDECVITIDTTLSAVARAALAAGADAVNDVSGGEEDPAMFELAAANGCGLVLMHRLVPPTHDVFSHQYPRPPEYGAAGVVMSVVDYLKARAASALAAGCARESVVLDPGLGFGKSVEQNLELIRHTSRLCELGHPVLSGVSRKSFTARAAGIDPAAPPRERVHASVGLSVAHQTAGARIFRVHDVAAHVSALRAAWAVTNPSG